MTYGTLRFRLSKTFPGVDQELFDGWIQDRYTEIMDELPWKRSEGTSIFQVPASVQATLTATQGSTTITGDGTKTWTAQLDGFMIRINNTAEYYTFTFVSANTATLDRPFEQANGSGLSYRIDQAVFLMPQSCREVRAVNALHQGGYSLNVVAAAKLDRASVSRNDYGSPVVAAYSWDTFSDPPIQQIELFPVPSSTDGSTLSFSVDYIFDPQALDQNNTSGNFAPWARPGCLIAGVSHDVCLYKGETAKAEMHGGTDGRGGAFGALLTQMKRVDGRQRGPQAMRMSEKYSGGPRWRRERIEVDGVPGQFHEGWPG